MKRKLPAMLFGALLLALHVVPAFAATGYAIGG
jgi:hypothetical protein